jgi:hypothetical protein
MSINFTSQVFTGYQGWFATPANIILQRWSHWSKSGEPRYGSTAFELYPDTSEYQGGDLYPGGYAGLNGGGPSLLFDADCDGVIDVHFRWMKEYGIDGVSLQRFACSLKRRRGRWRNSTAGRVRKFSEMTGKSFYIMYDISGHSGEGLAAFIEDDFENFIKKELLESPRYARQNGRPVVAIWGFGFTDRNGSKEDAEKLIKRLKEVHGCYVAGGVPYYWRQEKRDSKTGWLGVYRQFDMLIPWAVGRYASPGEVNRHYEEIWKPDKEFCDADGIDLQRVIYPGFAWSNLKGHQSTAPGRAFSRHVRADAPAPKNQIPRLAGRFFWTQVYNVARLGTSAFIAMFDEYDEGTAIAKAAADQSKIPSDQYFLTLDADGTQVSSNFYLRLAGEGTRMIKGERPLTPDVPIAHRDYRVHVTHAYRGILGREPDPRGLEDYVNFLAKGGTVLQFCRKLIDSVEFRNYSQDIIAEKFAEELYQKILGRPSDPGGFAHTVEEIQNGRLTERAAAMLNSPEFHNRFLS